MREWVLKPGEMKPLARSGMLLLASRCALRVEPWIPKNGKALWRDNLAFVVAEALAPPTDPKDAAKRARALSDCGADACNRLDSTDEPLGHAMAYAMTTLATAVEATALDERGVRKLVIDAAKYSASLFAVWAHAGRVKVRKGQDAVEVSAKVVWGAIRHDIAFMNVLQARPPVKVADIRLPVWQGAAPIWAAPP